jgi:hypothetical protein
MAGWFKEHLMSKLIALEGQKFGFLTVLRRDGAQWLCSCECGNEALACGKDLRRGFKLSCGKRDRHFGGNASTSWRGFGEIPKRNWTHILRHAENRKLLFDLTIEQAWELFLKQNRRCAISGVALHFQRPGRKNFASQNASLDRIDSAHGYTISNVQWVHKVVQEMKWDHEQKTFIKWCHLISEYNVQFNIAVAA